MSDYSTHALSFMSGLASQEDGLAYAALSSRTPQRFTPLLTTR
ncbi:hypothetical protein SAMN05216550_1523 [Paraburkholderia tropica]|uniref:Uncharacterized protein n=1 Tax=Paraburkholderia tropica TaxID=92647 RepID=A0AAQ1JYT1_9BURK|nr:hypothetical protein SAMN05216550_1523 [Paraburkholderia tropica]